MGLQIYNPSYLIWFRKTNFCGCTLSASSTLINQLCPTTWKPTLSTFLPSACSNATCHKICEPILNIDDFVLLNFNKISIPLKKHPLHVCSYRARNLWYTSILALLRSLHLPLAAATDSELRKSKQNRY